MYPQLPARFEPIPTDHRIPKRPMLTRRRVRVPSAEARLRVMGIDLHVTVVGHDAHFLVQHARVRLLELARRWDAMAPDSEVSRIVRDAGSWCLVSPETHLLVRRAHARGLEVADHVGAVRLDPGVAFDPTAFAPSVAAELVTSELALRGADDVNVIIGEQVGARTIRL